MSHLAGNTSEPRRNDIVLFSSPPEFLFEEEVSVLMLVCLDCSRLLFEFSWCRIGVGRGEREGEEGERERGKQGCILVMLILGVTYRWLENWIYIQGSDIKFPFEVRKVKN